MDTILIDDTTYRLVEIVSRFDSDIVIVERFECAEDEKRFAVFQFPKGALERVS